MKEDALIKKLRHDVKQMKRDITQRTKELSFFISSGKALTSVLEFNKVLRIIMERARRLIKCEAWSLLLLDESKQELVFALVRGGEQKKLKKVRVRLGQGIAGWVAKTGQPVIVPDVRKDRRFMREIDQVKGLKSRSVLCVPIINKKKTVGVLEMINKRAGAPFEEKDQKLLMELVDQAAIALERSSLYQQMSNLAISDDLTKLFNFRHLDQTLDHEISRCQRYGSMLSLIFLDMDYFKLVNDHHGHLMGSRVLIEVAQILVRSLRSVDIIARYGGDEFVVVLPETSVKTTLRIAQRLHRAIQDYEFLKEEGLKLRLTASFGISGFPEHASIKKDLIRLADQAMYQAKNSGRNQIFVAGTRSGP